MPSSDFQLFVGSLPRSTARTIEAQDKYTARPMANVSIADDEMVDEAIGLAVQAQPKMAAMPAYARRDALLFVARELNRRRGEFAQTLVAEVGKPIALAQGEVDRAIDTFTESAQEATRMVGEYLPLDSSPRGAGLEAICKRVPIGPCSFITPFNFPLNLAAHKVAPAIAAGCTWILKPDDRTPVTSLMLGEILAQTDLPKGAFSVLPCLGDGRRRFSQDDRLKLLSFTGSPKVGWMLKANAGRKKVVLELGGNAACVVDRRADLDQAAQRLVLGSFYQAGQSCISVQRIIAHESLYESLRDQLTHGARRISEQRDPMDPATILGPMIDEQSARRAQQWAHEAVEGGATLVTGGERSGAWLEPTLLENTPHTVRASCQEIFAPVVLIESFSRFDDALDRVNDSEWGLQAGVFTPSFDHAMRAFNSLDVGGVVVNDIPSTRVDAMPYGGVKGSGVGREGPRSAIESMTELRLLLLSNLGR